MFQNNSERIYKNTHLDQNMVKRLQPLMESAFADDFKNLSHGARAKFADERKRFIIEQYANRVRTAGNMGQGPLFEDSQIFGTLPNSASIKTLFESISTPGNIVGMGNVQNPDSSWQHTGGIWNDNYKSGTGDLPTYVFGLQSHIALNCIGFDLLPTIAVDTPKVVLNYRDIVYGGGPMDDPENMPTFIEFAAPQLTAAFAKTNELSRGTTEMIFRAADGDGADAIKVRFILRSTVKPAVTVEVLSTGTVTAAHAYTETNDKSVKEIVDAMNAGTQAKVVVNVNGTLTPTSVTNVVIDYASATRTTIREASTNDGTGVRMNRAQHRKGPKYKLNIISFDKQVEVRGIEIEADTDNLQLKDMAAQGINVIASLYAGVQNQLIQHIDEDILDHLYAMGVQHAVNVYKSQGKNYSLYIDKPANASLPFTDVDVIYKDMLGSDVRSEMGSIENSLLSATYENQATHMDRLYARILLVSEFVGQQNRIGTPDFLVAGGELCAAMKKHSTYTASPIANTLANNPELFYSGTIFETISLYKNPRIDFSDPRMLLGRRGSDSDVGSKLIAYDLAASRQTLAEQTMAEKIRVWSRYEIVDVGFLPELNYYTLVAINKYNWA